MRDYSGFKQGFIFCFMLGVALFLMSWGMGCGGARPASDTQPFVDNSAPLAHTNAVTTDGKLTDAGNSAAKVTPLLEKKAPTQQDITNADKQNKVTITAIGDAKTSNTSTISLTAKSDQENQTLHAQVATLEATIATLQPKADKWDAYEKDLGSSWVYWRVGGKLKAAFWWVLGIVIGIAVLVVILDWATDGATGKIFGLLGKPIGWLSDGLDAVVRKVAECIGYIIGHISASKATTVAAVRAPVKT